jgi:iron only hydrogenase large subunit-like protein
MAPNHQNDWVYAPKGMDPHETVESREQGIEKMMCWAGCVNGKVLQIKRMIDKNNDHISMTGPVYVEEIIQQVR